MGVEINTKKREHLTCENYHIKKEWSAASDVNHVASSFLYSLRNMDTSSL